MRKTSLPATPRLSSRRSPWISVSPSRASAPASGAGSSSRAAIAAATSPAPPARTHPSRRAAAWARRSGSSISRGRRRRRRESQVVLQPRGRGDILAVELAVHARPRRRAPRTARPGPAAARRRSGARRHRACGSSSPRRRSPRAVIAVSSWTGHAGDLAVEPQPRRTAQPVARGASDPPVQRHDALDDQVAAPLDRGAGVAAERAARSRRVDPVADDQVAGEVQRSGAAARRRARSTGPRRGRTPSRRTTCPRRARPTSARALR